MEGIYAIKDFSLVSGACVYCGSHQIIWDGDEDHICLDCKTIFQYTTMGDISLADWEEFKNHFLPSTPSALAAHAKDKAAIEADFDVEEDK